MHCHQVDFLLVFLGPFLLIFRFGITLGFKKDAGYLRVKLAAGTIFDYFIGDITVSGKI